MNDEPSNAEFEFRSQLDRMVSGDLDESHRVDLIRFMESHPQHWRACALAFLEAQLWNESMIFASATQPHVPMLPSVNSEPIRLEKSTLAAHKRFQFPISLVTAASILLAFAMGWVMDRGVLFLASNTIVRSPNFEIGSGEKTGEFVAGANRDLKKLGVIELSSNHPLGNNHLVWATRVLPSEGDLPGARIQIPLDPDRANPDDHEIKLSTYEKQRLARRGLEFSTQRQFINAKLPDGTDVAVPVDRIMARIVVGEIN